MKRLYSILTIFIVAFTAMANGTTTVEPLDSMSYVLGHQYTISMLAGENELMRNRQDFEAYIRGLEENLRDMTFKPDSSYMLSYGFGCMRAVFMTDGHLTKKDRVMISYMLEGLRKVAEGRVELPADTIAAIDILRRYKKKVDPKDLKENAQREYCQAYGIMIAFQPGLQKSINELLNLDKNIVFDRQAYVSGMVDALDMYLEEKIGMAYSLGKSMALSIKIQIMSYPGFVLSSFIAGAKAALQLGKQLIAREQVEDLFNKQINQDDVVLEDDNDDEIKMRYKAYIKELEIMPDEKYSVNWDITAQTVASDIAPDSDKFRFLLQKFNIEENKYDGILMALTSDDKGDMYDSILPILKTLTLTNGYEWFCGRNHNNEFIIGIMDMADAFKAKAVEASVEYAPTQSNFIVPFTFDSKGTAEWSRFTGNNIGKHIAVNINGDFICAPRIANEITSGCCLATGVSPETVNQSFNGASMVKDYTADEIEVIIDN